MCVGVDFLGPFPRAEFFAAFRSGGKIHFEVQRAALKLCLEMLEELA